MDGIEEAVEAAAKLIPILLPLGRKAREDGGQCDVMREEASQVHAFQGEDSNLYSKNGAWFQSMVSREGED